jgi:hypothetical protein
MDAEKFIDQKLELLKVAGDIDQADLFFGLYIDQVQQLGIECYSVDPETREKAREQIKELREVAGIQVKFLAHARRTALVKELDTIPDETFIKA